MCANTVYPNPRRATGRGCVETIPIAKSIAVDELSAPMQTTITVDKEVKRKLQLRKGESQTWNELLTELARNE